MFNTDRISEFVELAKAFNDKATLKLMEDFALQKKLADEAIKYNEKLAVNLQFDRNVLEGEKANLAKAKEALTKEQAKVANASEIVADAQQEAAKARQKIIDTQFVLDAHIDDTQAANKRLADKEAKLDAKLAKAQALEDELNTKLNNLKTIVA